MNHWVRAATGGALLGAGASILLLASGRLGGVGGIVGRLVRPVDGDVLWRLVFVGCLLIGGLAGSRVAPDGIVHVTASPLRIALGGLLIGLGTRLGNGCTSGHGVCGVGRMSRRSIAATILFTVSGAVTHLVDVRLLGAP